MIELEFYIPLSPDLAWEKLVQPAHLHEWWGKNVMLETSQKGRFSESWDHLGKAKHASGTVTAFEPSRRLQLDYSLHEWPRATRIEILLTPEKQGTRLYIQHSGWDALPEEADRRKYVDEFRKIWQGRMESFAKYCAA
jgi:uncharacterized protein YndB with AHSA1/START domain